MGLHERIYKDFANECADSYTHMSGIYVLI